LAKAAPVVGDHPATMLQQHRDLLIPGTATEWVAMDQDNRPSRAVVFIIQVDRARVLLADLDVRHSFLLGCGVFQIGHVTGKSLRLPHVSVKGQDVEGSCPSTSGNCSPSTLTRARREMRPDSCASTTDSCAVTDRRWGGVR